MDELVGPPLPPIASSGWQAFQELHAVRPIGAQTIAPISYTEIDAYCRVTETTLTALDLVVIRAADDAFVHEIATRMTPEPHAPSPPEV